MRARRPAPRPRATTGRTVLVAVVLSLLLPGLGHAWTYRLTRALVWFAGTIVVGIVLGQGEAGTPLTISMGAVLAALAAIDVALVMWLESRSPRGS